MPYYLRAFCTAKETPTINTVLQTLSQLGFLYDAQVDDPAELDSAPWGQFDLIYKADKRPIVVECDHDDGKESLVREECGEFAAELAGLDDSPAKEKVLKHLKKTRFIVSCQLLSDIDEDGHDAKKELLGYFVDHCGGMIQADGEGFYEGMDETDLLLPME